MRREFITECGLTDATLNSIDFYAGSATVQDHIATPGARVTVVPIIGLCIAPPEITVNQKELRSYRWVRLADIRDTEKLSPGYLEVALPAILGAIGLSGEDY